MVHIQMPLPDSVTCWVVVSFPVRSRVYSVSTVLSLFICNSVGVLFFCNGGVLKSTALKFTGWP